MPQDIRISTSIDASSVRVAENAFKGLLTLADKLNKATDRVSQSVNKINTGSQSRQSRPGSIKANPQSSATGISGAIIGDPSQAERATDRIIKSFDRLEQRAARMGNTAKAMGGGEGWASKAIYAMEEKAWASAGGPSSGFTGPAPNGFGGLPGSSFAPSGAPSNPIVPVTNPGGGGKGGGGWNGSTIGGVAGGFEALAAGNLGGFLGSTVGRLGIAGAVAYGGYKIADAAGNYVNNLYGREQQFAINFPIQQQQAAASVLSPFKAYGQNTIGRNLVGQYGMEQALQDPAFKNLVRQDLWKETIETKLGINTLTGAAKAKFSGIGPSIVGLAHGVVPGMSMSGSSLDLFSGGKINPAVLETKKWALGAGEMPSNFAMTEAEIKQGIGPKQAAALRDLAEAKEAQLTAGDQYFLNAMGGGGAMSRVKSLRMSGRSTADVMVKGKPMSAYEYYQSRDTAGGWDLGDDASEYQQLLSIGRGYRKVFGGHELISAGIEGFGNLGQLVKSMGVVGGDLQGANAYRQLINGKNGLTGTGGLDVAVARDLFQNIAQGAVGSGMYGASNLEYVTSQMASYVYGGGADVAGQQRLAMAYSRGSALEQTYTSGSRSPFDKDASWQDSIYATGGRFNASTIRLQEMAGTDPNLLASIAYGGAKVPFWADELINKESAVKYFDSMRTRSFAQVVDSQWQDAPKHAAALRTIRENNNDPNAVFRERLSDKSLGKVGGKKWRDAEWETAQFLGGFLGGDKLANAGKLSLEFLRTTDDLVMPSGRGAHATAPGGKEALELARVKAVKEALAEHGGNLDPDTKAKLEKKYGAKEVDKIIKERGAGNDLSSLSDAFVKAASNLASAIKQRAPKEAQGTR
jgi:hypothetical protein